MNGIAKGPLLAPPRETIPQENPEISVSLCHSSARKNFTSPVAEAKRISIRFGRSLAPEKEVIETFLSRSSLRISRTLAVSKRDFPGIIQTVFTT